MMMSDDDEWVAEKLRDLLNTYHMIRWSNIALNTYHMTRWNNIVLNTYDQMKQYNIEYVWYDQMKHYSIEYVSDNTSSGKINILSIITKNCMFLGVYQVVRLCIQGVKCKHDCLMWMFLDICSLKGQSHKLNTS